MTTEKLLSLQVTHRYKASAERVFDTFLDPAKAAKFMFTSPSGEMVRIEVDARVGGSYLFVDRREEMDWEHYGEYLEIDRPRRLVFTLGARHMDIAPQRVIIEIVPKEGGCELTLTHELEPGLEEWVDKAREGWTSILEKLAGEVG